MIRNGYLPGDGQQGQPRFFKAERQAENVVLHIAHAIGVKVFKGLLSLFFNIGHVIVFLII